MKRLERLPVRWRLAAISAVLTFVILLLFALVVGVFTAREVHTSFDNEVRLTADNLQTQLRISGLPLRITDADTVRALNAGEAAVRITSADGHLYTPGSPDLGPVTGHGLHTFNDYRVATRTMEAFGRPLAYLQYARRLSDVHHTVGRVRLFLIFGVLVGTALALLAGLGLARRAMAPIVNLTRAAQDIARTRDPGVTIPKPAAEDEVAELARTLEQMLMALDAARGETQAALDRQRQFVADASHELRTPLTSILANLELLEAALQGEDAEIAGSALRSSRRMRRLVGDLLLLARADAGRPTHHERIDVAGIVREAASEAAPVAAGHDLTVDLCEPDGTLTVDGSSDELHRLTLNLIQNALVHTPPRTSVEIAARRDGGDCLISVTDHGPGIQPELRERIFDRFVRGAADRGGAGSGLGLAIVRAVAESHDGAVTLTETPGGGAHFEVRIPLATAAAVVRPGAVAKT